MKRSQETVIINESNLSVAWGRAVIEVLDRSGTEMAPFLLSLVRPEQIREDFEVGAIRAALDQHLARRGMYDVDTVAWTIFPEELWQRSRSDRSLLFERYRDVYPRYKALNPALNSRGLYFGRLIDFGSGPCDGNQLEWIISNFKRRRSVRRSMLQASVFDPAKDHVRQAQLGFPCLQQVQFVPADGSLSINAFYATQQLFDKAYGNWLGLWNLGEFMGSQMGLELAQLNCFVGVEKLERVGKRELGPLADVIREVLRER